jgi:hypothetical protein
MGPTMRCRDDFPPPKVSPEREGLARAMVYRAIKQRLAEIEAQRGESAAE